MKSVSIMNYIVLFFILICVAILYKRFKEKLYYDDHNDNYKLIREYLLNDIDLVESWSNSRVKKPILWIHVPNEYNSRKWLSFGSRSSHDINQPYLYLTVRTILTQCSNSFTICMIDDSAFRKLIPGWKINMTKISDPVLQNMRQLGLMRILQSYGGMICPVSFLCMKDLIGLYKRGTSGDKMFLCETADKNITSESYSFYPNIQFCGANKNNYMVGQIIDFMLRIYSSDYTSESVFLGDVNRFCEKRINNGQINLIDGVNIGIKNIDEEPILIEDLMSVKYLKLYPSAYGILIPADEIISRTKYQWFSRLSHKQVLESNTIIGNYILLSISPDAKKGILEPLINKPNWVGFWKTPLIDGVYGLKPNYLGDEVQKLKFTGR
jgi:hypothetical protein